MALSLLFPQQRLKYTKYNFYFFVCGCENVVSHTAGRDVGEFEKRAQTKIFEYTKEEIRGERMKILMRRFITSVLYHIISRPCSSVGIATDLGLKSPGIETR